MSIGLVLMLALGGPVDVGAVALPDPKQKLNKADVEARLFVELAILRNHIFARHGRTFTKDWVQAFFDKQPWYKPDRDYEDARLSEVDRANLAVLSRAESVSPAALRVRRNTVFARHGRAFKSADLRAHFEKQPWYKVDPAFSMKRLTPRDTLEVNLIQGLEARAQAVEGLDKWAPGRRINKATLADASEWDLARLSVRMVEQLQLAGFAELCQGPVFMLDLEEDSCEPWKKHTRAVKKLPRVDKETWSALERRLAQLAVSLDHYHWEACEFECEDDMKCMDRCESRQKKEEAAHERGQKKRLAAVNKGKHAHGAKLLNQLMSVLAQSAA